MKFRPISTGMVSVIVGTLLSSTAFAGLITVNWGSVDVTGLALSNGTLLPTGNLIQIGTFSSTDGFSSTNTATQNLANFSAFAQGFVGDAMVPDGFFSESTAADEGSFSHQQIYLVALNASTVGAATQIGIFALSFDGSAPTAAGRQFPASSDFINTTSVDLEDLVTNPGPGATLNAAGGALVLMGSGPDANGDFRLASLASDSDTNVTIITTNFSAVAGVYSGLVQTNPPTPATTGILSLTMTDTGSFSATLGFGKNRLSFKGQFDDSGDYSTSLATKLGTVSISLHAESADGIDQITGTVANGSFTSQVLAKLATSNPATLFQGYYTLLFEPDSTNTDFPQGTGFAAFTVDASGGIKLKGTLGEGTKIKQTAVVAADGSWPVYIPVSKTGLLSGWITFTNIVGVSDLNGTLTWTKPAGAKVYPNGFTGTVTAEGAHYTPPAAGTPALSVSNGTCNVLFTAGKGNLGSFLSNSVTLDTANKMTPCVADKSKFKITSTTGLFSGSFPNPATGKATKFSGALMQKPNLGAGFFLGAGQSGFVTLAPAP